MIRPLLLFSRTYQRHGRSRGHVGISAGTGTTVCVDKDSWAVRIKFIVIGLIEVVS